MRLASTSFLYWNSAISLSRREKERDRKKHLRKKGVFVVTETGKRRRGGEAKGKEEEKDSLLFLISPWSHA